MPKILLLDEPHPKARAILESFAECIYPECIDNTYPQTSADYNAIYTQLTPVTAETVVFCPCTGIDHIEAPKVFYLDDEWKKTEGLKVTSTAEHTWSLILQLAKKKKMQLSGKTLGIIGYGRIGQQITEYAKAFKMKTRVYDKNFFNCTFDQLLRESDIITLHIPLEGNKGFIGWSEFPMMKKGVLLVNTSRFEIMDYKATLANVLNGTIGGIAHDFSNKKFFFKGKAHCEYVQTPHIGGNCLEAREMTDIYTATKIKEYFGGQNEL